MDVLQHSVKFRLVKIFPKNLILGQKSDQNPIVTRQVFMNFKVQKSEFLVSEPPLFTLLSNVVHCS